MGKRVYKYERRDRGSGHQMTLIPEMNEGELNTHPEFGTEMHQTQQGKPVKG